MLKQLIRQIRGAKDPTADWPEHVRQDLTYDLRSKSINGYAMNAPIEGARGFGKSDDYSSMGEFLELYYRPSGLVLMFAASGLMQVDLMVSGRASAMKEHELDACTPSLIDLQGVRFAASESTTLADLTARLGAPVESGPIVNEMMHSFILGGNFIDAYHDMKSGGLLLLEITESEEG